MNLYAMNEVLFKDHITKIIMQLFLVFFVLLCNCGIAHCPLKAFKSQNSYNKLNLKLK